MLLYSLIAFVLNFMATASSSAGNSLNQYESAYLNDTVCDVQTRISYGCAKKISSPSVRAGKYACLLSCGRDPMCVGASIDRKSGVCFHHETCPSSTPCNGIDPDHAYWASYCVHGTWNGRLRSCKCLLGSTGVRCEKSPVSCQALIPNGYAKGQYRAVLDLEGDGSNPLTVTCYVEPPSGHSVRMMRNSGQSSSFNKTWLEYVYGFRQDENNFWTGLRAWHYLSEKGYLRMTLNLKIDDVLSYFTVCSPFKVDAEGTKFALTTHGQCNPGRIGRDGRSVRNKIISRHCFSGSNFAFSTWDSDNAKASDGVNCASQVGAGWWYPTTCRIKCKFLGVISFYSGDPHQTMVIYGVDDDMLDDLAWTEMSITT